MSNLHNYNEEFLKQYEGMNFDEFRAKFDIEGYLKTLSPEELNFFAIDIGIGDVNTAIDNHIDKTLDDYNSGMISNGEMKHELKFLRAK